MRTARYLLLIPVELLPNIGHAYTLQWGIAKTEVARFLRRALIGLRCPPPGRVTLFYRVARVLVHQGYIISRNLPHCYQFQVLLTKALDDHQTVGKMNGSAIVCGTIW